MSLETDINECLEEKKALSKKRGRLMIYDKVATSLGAISFYSIPISLMALIPLGASIGLGIYVNKKDEETYDKMREINSRYNALKKEEKRERVLSKKK